MQREERIFNVNDLALHVIHWKPAEHSAVGRRWICLHGWLDNAGSFVRVAEELSDAGHEVIAFDMAGCGRSSHRTLHGGYNLWDDILDLEAMVDLLGWEDYGLIGHSRGAMIAAIYAATRPTSLQRLVLIDGVLPPTKEVDPFVEQLRDFLSMRRQLIEKNTKVSQLLDRSSSNSSHGISLSEAWRQRNKNCSLTQQEMQPILERGLVKLGDTYLWSHDQRLKGRSVYRLNIADQQHVLDSLEIPGLLLIAKEYRLNNSEHLSLLDRSLKSFSIVVLDGGHHMHMQDEHYHAVVKQIKSFVATEE